MQSCPAPPAKPVIEPAVVTVQKEGVVVLNVTGFPEPPPLAVTVPVAPTANALGMDVILIACGNFVEQTAVEVALNAPEI